MNYYYHYHIIFLTYIKWHKDLSAKYYQDNKERLQKIVKDIKVLLKKIKKKKNRNNMDMSDTKASQKMKSNGWLSIEKI